MFGLCGCTTLDAGGLSPPDNEKDPGDAPNLFDLGRLIPPYIACSRRMRF